MKKCHKLTEELVKFKSPKTILYIMQPSTNIRIYQRRIEPKCLKSSDNYINLRVTDNVAILVEILDELKTRGPNYVIASWISPPFGVIKGYGVYEKEEVMKLSDASKRERWGFPRFGSVVDQERLEGRIEKLKRYHC